MKITIPGNPIPKARARVTRRGFAYDPQDKQKKEVIRFLEQTVREFYEKDENRQEGYKLAHGEAFEVDWHFYMPIPKSFNQTQKNACKWGFIQHTSKPDRSNLEKFYEDCANGILWHDDSQITRGNIIKAYCNDDKPKTEIHMKVIRKHDDEIKEIVSLFSPDEIQEMVLDANYVRHEPNLPLIASFISKIADKHSKKLNKITKNYPDHWKKFESNSNIVHC